MRGGTLDVVHKGREKKGRDRERELLGDADDNHNEEREKEETGSAGRRNKEGHNWCMLSRVCLCATILAIEARRKACASECWREKGRIGRDRLD